MKKIRPAVFLPPFLFLLAVVVLSFIDQEAFALHLTTAYEWVINTTGWFVSLLAFLMLVLCVVIYFSPFGRVVIGGPDAKPMLTKWRLFTIVLCTTIAAGILFWAPIEPVLYLNAPPKGLGIEANTPDAAMFAISKIYLHWTCIPYAIGAVVGLMFAFAYYNMKQPFSLGAPLSPLLGSYSEGRLAQVIDAVCLYMLVAAMAAALGGASLLLGGGVNYILGIEGPPSDFMLAAIMAAIMGTAVVAAISGVVKGIRIVADINTVFLIGFLAMVLFLGPTRFILSFAVEGFGHFLSHYFEKALFTGAAHQEVWPQKWTQMQFSAWFAWAPIMGVFLGRIAYGYTVRAFLVFNVLLPALFTGTWMAIFCGAVVHMQLHEGIDLAALLDPSDPSRVLYAFLDRMPFTNILVTVLLITGFLSLVTTADGNTDAMSSISSAGISPQNPESSMFIKIAWGLVMGLLSWVMVTFARLDGIRMLSNLGGVPALFLCLGIGVCAIRVILNPARFDVFHDDYGSTTLRNAQGDDRTKEVNR